MGFLLANHGVSRTSGKQVIPKEDAVFMNAVLTTCGMYDGSGEFAIKVGIPAKSGAVSYTHLNRDAGRRSF